jgi:hypothetical protein
MEQGAPSTTKTNAPIKTYHRVLMNLPMEIKALVSPGRSTPDSSSTPAKLGTTVARRIITTTTANTAITAGYVIAPLILCLKS